jgi:hypothetical protein
MMSGMLPAGATVVAPKEVVAASNVQSTTFVKRYFSCYAGYGCQVTATLPATWRYVKLNRDEFRFADRSAPRMIRIRVGLGDKVSTATAAAQKQAALRGTRGLKVLSRSTTTMTSTMQQGPLTVTTLVYTYRSGSTTRWVATRYVGQHGERTASLELSVGGRVQDRALLTTVLNKATTSMALYG